MAIETGGLKSPGINRPLGLSGTSNTRDIGGYPTSSGGITASGRYLRSDSPHLSSDEDIVTLARLGLRTVVDLRSPDEVARKPSKLAGAPGVRYLPIPIVDDVGSHGASRAEDEGFGSMADLYRALLSRAGDRFVRVFEAFASSEGLSLFNCAAGKDRTGLVAMLLLGLAGVPDELIVADYAATSIYMAATFDAQRAEFAKRGVEVPKYYFDSRAEDMRATLTLLAGTYGGAAAYLRANGLGEDALRRVVAGLKG